MNGAQRLGIEQVPELQHHESSEEYREFMVLYTWVCTIFAIYQHRKHQDEERDSAKENAVRHLARDDEIGLLARFLLHHLMRRRQRSECHSGKSIHNQIDPKNLRHRKRQLGAYHGTGKYQQQGSEIDHQLEKQEPLYVLIQRTAPHHGTNNRTERVVEQRHIRSLLCHTGTRTQRQAHMGIVQSRGIVGAIASHSHHFAMILEQLHEPLLIGRTCTRHHLEGFHTIIRILITEFREVCTCDVPVGLVRIGIFIPNANLFRYLYRRGGSVARNDFHLDSGIHALSHCRRNFSTQRIADGGNSLEGKSVGYRLFL